MAYFLVARVFAEEFFFRAFLVPRIGVIGSSLAFGLAHITYGSAAEVIGAVVLGAILGIAYSQKKSLLANFLGHFLYNALALVVFLSG